MYFNKPKKFNLFTFFKLPAAWWCGVRVKKITEAEALVTVKHRWVNQNPFKSMFWAVQGMAAELATGALVIAHIAKTGKKISMLVVTNNATFTKKARGLINFSCTDGHVIADAIIEATRTGEGQTFWMQSKGIDVNGDVVSTFNFEWSIKVK